MSRSRIAEVQPLSGFDKSLYYKISQEIADQLEVGSLVRIPLGTRSVLGLIFSLNPTAQLDGLKLKKIQSLVQKEPVISEELIKLARWMSIYYSSSIETVLETMIPAPIRNGMQASTQRFIQLEKKISEAHVLTKLKRSPKQKILYDYLKSNDGTPVKTREVMRTLSINESVINGLTSKGIARIATEISERIAYLDEIDQEEKAEMVEHIPTKEQSESITCISSDLSLQKFTCRLLEGVTGSGKTEVYIQAMKIALSQDRGVIFLVPEVALAPQTVSRLRNAFQGNEDVVVWHSHLSAGERLDSWRKLSQGRARIAVGARSAVFAPVQQLGLVVVDEEHEPAFKQEDNPRYHARDIAVYRAKINNSICLLGSATPSMESLRNVQTGKYSISKLTKRIDGRELPLIHLVDMRRESIDKKTPTTLSFQLIEALRQRFRNGEQSILFLNRRGFNTSVFCPDCGEYEQCKDCSVGLTYHRNDDYLKCHLCGYQKRTPIVCPKCKSINLRKQGYGTQRIEDIVSKLMPKNATVVRVDGDTLGKKNLLRYILRDFRIGKIDVLIGTQMIAKGLDFPNVTLVGVVDADLPLRMEDFRSSERAFQLLTQVAGRAGRGDRHGEVLIQTYAPHTPCIQYARKADLDGFIEEEMELRRELGYPPFRHLIRHVFRSRSLEKTEFYINQWKNFLNERPIAGLIIKGPVVAPIEKIKGFYRYHLIYFTSNTTKAVKILNERRNEFILDQDVLDILDVDAINLQ